MNKTLHGTILAAACGAALLALPAFAQTATGGVAQSADAVAAAQATTTTAVGTRAVKQRAVPAPGSRMCLQHTGSLIPPPKGQCLPVNGSSYSQQDIRRTGSPTVGGALQMLDPSITIQHH